jgi:hypothetical protein
LQRRHLACETKPHTWKHSGCAAGALSACHTTTPPTLLCRLATQWTQRKGLTSANAQSSTPHSRVQLSKIQYSTVIGDRVPTLALASEPWAREGAQRAQETNRMDLKKEQHQCQQGATAQSSTSFWRLLIRLTD